jgi:hypothetical protein
MEPGFFTSAVVGGEWLVSGPCQFTSEEKASVSFG